MKTLRIATMAAAFAAVPLTAALADRAPSLEERQIISDVLRSEGYTGWKEIEWDDNRWEVDDAIGPDGKRYDVELDSDFNILNSKLD